MFVVSVNSDLDRALQVLGHQVRSFSLTRSGIYSLRALLEGEASAPDLVLQKEHLGARILFRDLDTFHCTKAFWSIDTHLNYYWQRHYGRLFDVFLTPHKAYLAELSPDWLLPNLFRLPAVGRNRPWVPHTQRAHSMNFVGRLSHNRPLRTNFCAFLQSQYGVSALDGLPREAMMALYDQTRLVPNESIALETNFRLLEGASSGCCMISPDIGEDQDTLFTPGKEVLVYRDVLECRKIIDACLARPEYAAGIGQAAHARVQAEHLPRHRAARLGSLVDGVDRAALTGQEAGDSFAMCLCLLHLNGALTIPDVAGFAGRFHNPAAARLVRLFAAVHTGKLRTAREIVADSELWLQGQAFSDYEYSLTVACAGFALWQNHLEQARSLYTLHEQARGRCSVLEAGCGFIELCSAWIDALVTDKKYMAHGMRYRDGCCGSALDFILLAANREPAASFWARKFHDVRVLSHTLPHLDLTALARLSLNQADSLDASLDYISGALRMFDVRLARNELDSLFDRARQHGAQARLSRLVYLRLPHIVLLPGYAHV